MLGKQTWTDFSFVDTSIELIDENQMKYVQAKPSCFPAMFDEKHFYCVRVVRLVSSLRPEAPEILLFCSSFSLFLGGYGASSQFWLGLSCVVDCWGGRHGRRDLRYGALISDFGLHEFLSRNQAESS